LIYDAPYKIIPDDIFLVLRDLSPGHEVFLKIEGLNPAGSIKAKTALALIENVEETRALLPGGTVIESSSGNLGISLSMICAAKGYSFVCVTDPHVSRQSVALMRSLGAEIVVVDRRDDNGGYLGTRIAYVRDRIAAEPYLVWPNQYANEAGARVHAVRTAASVLAEIGRVDHLFVGAGSTGTLMGCAAHFREHSPATRIVAVDAYGSVTFGHPADRRQIPGLGTSRRPELLRTDSVDQVVLVRETRAVEMCHRLALPKGARVVAISPDLGDRYCDTVYDDDWVDRKFGTRRDSSLPAMALKG
jgi:cysteine synthase A